MWPHVCGLAACLLRLFSICSHLTWRGHSPASPLGCLLALPLGKPSPDPSQGFIRDLSFPDPVTPVLLRPPACQLLTAHSSWYFFTPSQPAPQLCLSFSSCVDITNRNIRVMLSFSSTGPSSVLSIFALAGLSICIETYSRNFNYSFGPSLSVLLWPLLLSLSAEFSRFC